MGVVGSILLGHCYQGGLKGGNMLFTFSAKERIGIIQNKRLKEPLVWCSAKRVLCKLPIRVSREFWR